MNNNSPRADTAFMAILVVLSAISMKVAFLHHAELMVLMLGIIPAIVIFYLSKKVDNGNEKQ